MVLKRKLYYGFDGYQVPVVPRAPRSVRRRLRRKPVEDSEICAFELLATVAGKLLQESENSASSSASDGKEQFSILNKGIQQEFIKRKLVKSECLDRGSCSESLFVSEISSKEFKQKHCFNKLPNSETLDQASIITHSDKADHDVKLEIFEGKNAVDGVNFQQPEGGFSEHGEVCDSDLQNGAKTQLNSIEKQTVNLEMGYTSDLHNQINMSADNLDSSVQLPSYRIPIPGAYCHKHIDDGNVRINDDDENSFRCNQPRTKIMAFRSQSNIGYRRIKKMLSSKYWKVAPKLKDCEHASTSARTKPFYSSRRYMYKRQRYQKEAPSRRRKLCQLTSRIEYDHDASSESISNSPEKVASGDRRHSSTVLHRGTTSVLGRKISFQSRDPNVKFSIKSFKVPELYIDVPETATVGSLKRTVMEAVTAILGGELRVGVLLQGKKVRDDKRTLKQTGISQSGDLDMLDFSLEPSFARDSPPLVQKYPPLLLACDTHKRLSLDPLIHNTDSGVSNSLLVPPLFTNPENIVERCGDIVPSPNDTSKDETASDSKALVVVPAMKVEALAIVPVGTKTKRIELSQRRTRRPFSVYEVEALVEAVEILGTGRWRDVKMRAFDDANHRTYVDLKDKWKTLVHTASISPQQRRGEPVPQELLDRVLAANAYWSRHQPKQHGKHRDEPHQMSNSQMVTVGV